MRVVISGDIRIYDPSPEIISWAEEMLTFRNPAYDRLAKRGLINTPAARYVQKTISGYYQRKGLLVLPFGVYPAVKSRIATADTEIVLARKKHIQLGLCKGAVALYPYQKQAVESLIEDRGGVLKAPCGSGKTVMGVELVRRIGLRFLWLCGQRDLARQTKDSISKWYPSADVGMTIDGKLQMGEDGTIATVQTLVNCDPDLYKNEFNVVVVDECHHVVSNPSMRKMYAKVLSNCRARYKYGLTATPMRADGLTGLIFANIGTDPDGNFKPAYEVREDETNALLAKYQTLAFDTKPSYSYLAPDGTIDYPALLRYLAENEERNEKICLYVSTLVGYEHRKVALLTKLVSHVGKLASMLEAKGIRVVSITGGTAKKKRDNALTNYNDWDCIVATSSLFKEGIDIRPLDSIVMALPVKDKVAIIQSEGRVERPFPDKKPPIFVYGFDKNIPYCKGTEAIARRILNRRKPAAAGGNPWE